MQTKLRYKLLIHIALILLCLSILIPFLYVISLSVTAENLIASGGYKLIPKQLDFAAYRSIFSNPTQLITSYKITIAFSVLGTALSMIVMTMIAYAISREQFAYKQSVTFFVYFTMLFSGGLIPQYIINTKYLHLTNNFWVYILPCLANAYHILILRTFFKGLPASLTEAAKIDGAGELTIFRIIVLPLSKPVLAVVCLYYMVANWNVFMNAYLYLQKQELYPIQIVLREILLMGNVEEIATNATKESQARLMNELLKYSLVIVASLPMILVYPFVQKYFVKGIMIGAVKG